MPLVVDAPLFGQRRILRMQIVDRAPDNILHRTKSAEDRHALHDPPVQNLACGVARNHNDVRCAELASARTDPNIAELVHLAHSPLIGLHLQMRTDDLNDKE